MQNKIPTAQLRGWLFAAAVPAILSVAGRNGWLAALLMAVGCGGFCFWVLSCKVEYCPKWLCVLEIIWLTVFQAGVAKISGSCWIEIDKDPWVTIILLVLAAWASQNGVAQSARFGATLLWLVIPLLGVVFLAGSTDIHWNWISTEPELPDGTLTTLLLIPCITLFFPKERKALRWSGVVLGVLAIATSLLLIGSMGRETAKNAANSFYEFSRGVTLLGIAERFESLVACALTGGLFSLLVLILSGVYQLAEKIFPPLAKWSVWLCALGSSALMCNLPNKGYWMVVGGVIFWGFLPVLAQGLGCEKNIEKN